MSDFVKFAKYDASETDKQESFTIIKRSIENIQKQTVDSPSTGGA
jgi:hypothetical protein